MIPDVMFRAELSCNDKLIGSFEGPLSQNRQTCTLFSNSPVHSQWEQQVLLLVVRIRADQHSDWMQIYEGGAIDSQRWLDDIAFVEKRLGANDLENMRICPLMPLDALSEGKMQLFFEATPKDDDEHERSLHHAEVT